MDASPLKRAAVQGALWTFGAVGFSNLLSLASQAILTRILDPAVFGLSIIVTVTMIGLSLVSDVGISQSVIRSSRSDDPAFLDTAWTLQILRNGVIWVIACLLGFPLASTYHQPDLIWLLPFVGFTAFVNGFSSMGLAVASRQMRVKRLVLFEASIQLLGLTTTVVWALLSPSIVALVGGNLVAGVARTVGSHFLTSIGVPRLRWDKAASKEVFSFGKWIFLSSLITFLAAQSDKLVMGKLVDAAALGVYGLAATLADKPRQLIQSLADRVIFPAVSQSRELPRPELRQRLLKNRRLLLLCAAPALALLVSLSDVVTGLLVGQRFASAAWMISILSVGIWPSLLSMTTGPALFAFGKPQYATTGNFIRFLFTAVGSWWAFTTFGIVGAVVAVALGDLPVYLVTAVGMTRGGLSSLKQDLAMTFVFLLFVAVGLGSRLALGFGFPIHGINIAWFPHRH